MLGDATREFVSGEMTPVPPVQPLPDAYDMHNRLKANKGTMKAILLFKRTSSTMQHANEMVGLL
jgi:hypothetical protein